MRGAKALLRYAIAIKPKIPLLNKTMVEGSGIGAGGGPKVVASVIASHCDHAEKGAEGTLFGKEASVEPRYEGRTEVLDAPSWPRAAYDVFIRSLSAIFPSSALAWAVSLTILIGTIGFFAYRHISAPINAAELLKEAVKVGTASLQGKTEHQVFQIEELSAEGQVLQRGTVDQWRDGDGNRYIRRLYDSQSRLIATKWRNRNGQGHSELQGESWARSNQRESSGIADPA
jgi:hypothetical protein